MYSLRKYEAAEQAYKKLSDISSKVTLENQSFPAGSTVSLEELTVFNEFWPSNIHRIFGFGQPSGAAQAMPNGSPSSMVNVLKKCIDKRFAIFFGQK